MTGEQCEGCERKIPAHKWGKIRAHSNGWFIAKDGKVYCPEHHPEWVESWRNRKAQS